MSGADQLRALLTEFAGEIRERLDDLATAVAAGDSDDVLRRAHQVKGTARTLDLPDVAVAMERLEQAYRGRPPRLQAARDALAAARHAAEVGPRPSDDVVRLGHALRTPLSVVLGFGHLLRDADLPPEAHEHADAVVEAAEQMVAIVDRATLATCAGDRAAHDDRAAGPAPATVLCIEDDPLGVRLVEEQLLYLSPARVLVARTGAEGIALARREHPELVLLDPGLPDLSGAEALRGLRDSLDETARIVVVTGETRAERLQEFLDAGADECLTKPLDPGRLPALVARAWPV